MTIKTENGITIFVAPDGVVFFDKDECIEYIRENR